MDNDFENYDFEEWEGDYQLIEEKNWVGLVKLRKQRAEKRHYDLHSQWSYGEALILNQKFKQALEFLTPIYKREPNYLDVIYSILDALYGLGKTENDFDWVKKPEVLKLNDETINLCKIFLKKKRKPISFLSLCEHLFIQFDYLKFQEKDLYEYLKIDRSFEFSDNEKKFWDVDIKLLKKEKN
jgi:hypothetical protein